MRLRKSRVLACAGALATVAAALVISPASADFTQDQGTREKVTQYLSIQYGTQMCDGKFAYKMNTISRRWHRDVSWRKVRAVSNYGVYGDKCDGSGYNQNHHSEWSPCFGCDGYASSWTPDYVAYPQYPYTYCKGSCQHDPNKPFGTAGDSAIGANLKGTVKNNAGDVLASICTKLTLYGSTSC